ncbi:MAG: hypothetical protein ACJATS_001366, partial [Psychroserpens sp.]
ADKRTKFASLLLLSAFYSTLLKEPFIQPPVMHLNRASFIIQN